MCLLAVNPVHTVKRCFRRFRQQLLRRASASAPGASLFGKREKARPPFSGRSNIAPKPGFQLSLSSSRFVFDIPAFHRLSSSLMSSAIAVLSSTTSGRSRWEGVSSRAVGVDVAFVQKPPFLGAHEISFTTRTFVADERMADVDVKRRAGQW
jgi:hypothetical protein